MAQVKPEYQVIDKFNNFAKRIVDKYPDIFFGIDSDLIRCVAITNKDRPDKKDKLWDLKGVPMPIRMDCPYSYYVTIYQQDWDDMSDKHKLVFIAEILNGVAREIENEGKIIPMDSKGYKLMQRTFKNIDYLQDPNLPDILEDDIDWKTESEF